jgi:hypothetical protein
MVALLMNGELERILKEAIVACRDSIPEFAWSYWRNPRKTSVSLYVRVVGEILSEHYRLPNPSNVPQHSSVINYSRIENIHIFGAVTAL